MARRLITLKDIQASKISRSRSFFMRLIRDEKFPKPVVAGSGSGGNLWDEADVDAWVEAYIASSPKASNADEKKRRIEGLNRARTAAA